MPLKGEARIINQRRELGQPNQERARERVGNAIYFVYGAIKDLPDDNPVKNELMTEATHLNDLLKKLEQT